MHEHNPAAAPPMSVSAVRVPQAVGRRALEILGPRNGAVIECPQERFLFWFIPLGKRTEWDFAGSRALPVQDLALPPLDVTGGPGRYWRVCPADDRWETCPDALCAALADASKAVGQEASA
ncbi:hypothetical protein CTZ27_33460 [Streptomyces griseocarneus]|nr:hypothetical protein CTZ27_33460 [Streptomyces griseocarneus]